MADQTQASIGIAADRAAIMKEIADFDSYPEWSSAVKGVRVIETGDDGRGKRVHFQIAEGPIKAEYTLDYTYLEGDAGVTWAFVEGRNLRDLSGSYELEDAGDGETLVTYSLRIDLAIPVMGFIKRQGERKIIDTALKGLKKRVESRR